MKHVGKNICHEFFQQLIFIHVSMDKSYLIIFWWCMLYKITDLLGQQKFCLIILSMNEAHALCSQTKRDKNKFCLAQTILCCFLQCDTPREYHKEIRKIQLLSWNQVFENYSTMASAYCRHLRKWLFRSNNWLIQLQIDRKTIGWRRLCVCCSLLSFKATIL